MNVQAEEINKMKKELVKETKSRMIAEKIVNDYQKHSTNEEDNNKKTNTRIRLMN